MAKKLYVGNLSYHTTDDTLRQAFSVFGDIASCTVVIDRYTNSSKGFGFVEMGSEQAAEAAISGMNGQSLDGRQIRVSEANDKPRTDRGDRGGYGGGDRGGYGGNRW
jgi:RNA recognition motif-containing protein